MPVIRVEDLNYRVDGQQILSDISFSVEQGDYVALLGPNGGGKTTLVKILLGLLVPNSGRIEIFGIDQ